MSALSPFCAFLIDRWRARLFCAEIFPGFPFLPAGWKALAFNRDTAGDIRLPKEVWSLLLHEIVVRTRETVALVVSPQPITEGLVAEREQPFIVPLNEASVLAHFADMKTYLPEFFMAGGSERWAIWGDSDMTVLGSESDLISSLIRELGGDEKVIEEMAHDFRLSELPGDKEMWAYLAGLVHFVRRN